MSQSRSVVTKPRGPDAVSNDSRTITCQETVQTVLDALEDEDCRAILDATREDALSTNELSERCDLPLSTCYRKLDLLTEAGLLEERTRIRRSGKHVSEYVRLVDEVTVCLASDGGIELRLAHREQATDAPQPAD